MTLFGEVTLKDIEWAKVGADVWLRYSRPGRNKDRYAKGKITRVTDRAVYVRREGEGRDRRFFIPKWDYTLRQYGNSGGGSLTVSLVAGDDPNVPYGVLLEAGQTAGGIWIN
jgi:hypothetical protein